MSALSLYGLEGGIDLFCLLSIARSGTVGVIFLHQLLVCGLDHIEVSVGEHLQDMVGVTFTSRAVWGR